MMSDAKIEAAARALLDFHSTVKDGSAWDGAGDITRANFREQARDALLAADEAGRELDPAELDFWRKAVAGEAGFNGQPQAVLALMRASDHERLERLRYAYPEAVAAFEEDRA